jgi:hypothetical protein
MPRLRRIVSVAMKRPSHTRRTRGPALVVLGLGLLAAACVRGGARSASSSANLRVSYLGVSGFLLEYGADAVLTAPLYTRPSWLQVTASSIGSDPRAIDANLPPGARNARAILSGHAHYDHLLDVPNLMARAPGSVLLANRSARNILAAHAPDRGPRCAATPPAFPPIARSRVLALDDHGRSVVDYSLCPSRRPPGAPITGSWVPVLGSNIRVMALCSDHPDQLGPMHYAPGGVEVEQCAPPARAAEWLEGTTLAFLVDFVDPATGAPVYRVYFQDAPTSAPVGLVPEALLREKRIDVALLCVGAYERVAAAPTTTLLGLAPRYAIGGHWEDFSRGANEPPLALPLLDLAGWVARARQAMPRQSEPRAMLQNGGVAPERFAVPRAGEWFEIGR